MEYEYNKDGVIALGDRLVNYTTEEFQKTSELGPANHFLAFADFYKTFLAFFFRMSTDEEGIEEMIRVLHEQEEDAKALCKLLGPMSDKLN